MGIWQSSAVVHTAAAGSGENRHVPPRLPAPTPPEQLSEVQMLLSEQFTASRTHVPGAPPSHRHDPHASPSHTSGEYAQNRATDGFCTAATHAALLGPAGQLATSLMHCDELHVCAAHGFEMQAAALHGAALR